jgi:hypothetical protein
MSDRRKKLRQNRPDAASTENRSFLNFMVIPKKGSSIVVAHNLCVLNVCNVGEESEKSNKISERKLPTKFCKLYRFIS